MVGRLQPEPRPNLPPPALDDRSLVAQVLARDRKATAAFVARCADYVYPFVRRRLMPDTAMLEDIVQEVMLAAWQNLPTYRGDAGIRAWVLGIARHKIDDYYRKRIRETELPEDEEEVQELSVSPRLEEEIDAAALEHKVQATLTSLPEAYCLALLWRYRDNRSARDMAELTGKSEKAIERLLSRARDSFRKKWSHAQL
jgi:RNA polymerase sigma-70 factor (ECF subfamily)